MKSFIRVAVALAACAAVARADVAVPTAPQTFGRAGLRVFSLTHGFAWDTGSSFQLSYRHDNGKDTTILRFQPSLDYFLTDHLSLGFTAGLSYLVVSDTSGSGRSVLAHLGGRLGFSFTIVPWVSALWPKVSVVGGSGQSQSLVSYQVYVPLVVHTIPGFVVGVGPVYERMRNSVDGQDTAYVTAYGVLVTFGGCWMRGS